MRKAGSEMTASAEIRFCAQCGQRGAESDRFCEACGTPRRSTGSRERMAAGRADTKQPASLGPSPVKVDRRRPGAVFWYGVVIAAFSFYLGLQMGNALDGMLAVAINWSVFVVPVLVIRNLRRSRMAAKAAA
jgi:hypothetical protein